MPDSKRLVTSKTNKYEVIRKLGEGYTGEVFLVKDIARNEPVALKLLNPEAFKEGQLEAFKREFFLLSDLHHPHLCKVYDFGLSDSDKRYFFTSELIQGTDLYTYTDRLSTEEIEEIFVQVTDALGFIHASGLIHFDMKGANVLVTLAKNKALAKIVDFGLAAPSVNLPEKVVGTVRYISPEMITKKHAIDYRADLYSLGIMFHRMLTKDYPNQGSTMKEVIQWHTKHTSIDREPFEKQGIPKYLIEVVEKLTNPIPAERFSSADVIIRYIELHSGKGYKKTQRSLFATLAQEGPLVGRDKAMTKIRGNIAKLSKKEPLNDEENPTLVIAGPNGLGKSRILKETKYISQLNELQTLIIRGSMEGQDMQSFKKVLEVKPGDEGKDVIDVINSMQPLCLMVDDMDKCGSQVKDVLVGLVNSLYSSKFMGSPLSIYMIATMTTGGPKEALPIPLHLGVDIESLEPLGEQDITQYIRIFLGESNPQARQVKEIYSFSGGIPELVKTAIASLETSTAPLAKDANKIFSDLIGRLSPPAKKVLGTLAIADKPLTQQQLIVLTSLIVEAPLTELSRSGAIQYNRESEAYQLATGAISEAVKDILSREEKSGIAGSLLKYTEGSEAKNVDSMVKYASLCVAAEKMGDYFLMAGKSKEERNEIDQSLKYYQQALSVIKETDPRAAETHRSLARHLILKGKLSEATENINKASKLTKVTVEDLTGLSWIYRLQRNPEGAIKCIEDALKLPGLKSGEIVYLRLLNEKASCCLQMGNVGDAIKIFADTEGQVKNLPKEKRKEAVNNNLGMALARDGKFNEAIAFYKEKYETFKDDKRLSSSIFSQLGYVYQQANFLNEALSAYQDSWRLASETGDTHSAASILSNIINLCQSRALYTDALHYAQESIKLASSATSEKDLASNFLTIGSLYINLGLEDIAQKYLTEAATIFSKQGDARMEAWVQLSFAYLYKNISRKKEALAYLENVVKQGEAIGDREMTLWGYQAMSEIYLQLNDLTKANEFATRMGMPWPGIDKAQETDVKVELLRCSIAIASSSPPTKEVAGRLEELADLSVKRGFRELASEAFHTLGLFHEKGGDNKSSAKYLLQAKEIIDDIAGSLSEEYRHSFLRQQFRKAVSEDTVRLEKSIEYLPEDVKAAAPKSVSSTSIPGISDSTSAFQGQMGTTGALDSEYVAMGRHMIIGQSEAVLKIRDIIDHVKDSRVSVMIEGERGVGKELVAETIHNRGAFRGKPWQKIDVSALPEDFLMDELFGKEDVGIFEKAGDGTIFFKHIEKMSPDLQKDLLKVLKDGKFTRLKDKTQMQFKCRVITASNADTEALLKGGKFNKDFLKLLARVPIHIPPLRERKEDIPLLVDYYLNIVVGERNLSYTFAIEADALKILDGHSWPGNIRELEQVIRGACVLAKDGKIAPDMIKAQI